MSLRRQKQLPLWPFLWIAPSLLVLLRILAGVFGSAEFRFGISVGWLSAFAPFGVWAAITQRHRA